MPNQTTTKLDREGLETQFADNRLHGATIIEHRTDGEDVVGGIDYTGGPHGDGSVGIGWDDGFHRTTQFFPRSWEAHLHLRTGVIFMRRIAVDTGRVDMPWSECDKYTVIPCKAQRNR